MSRGLGKTTSVLTHLVLVVSGVSLQDSVVVFQSGISNHWDFHAHHLPHGGIIHDGQQADGKPNIGTIFASLAH